MPKHRGGSACAVGRDRRRQSRPVRRDLVGQRDRASDQRLNPQDAAIVEQTSTAVRTLVAEVEALVADARRFPDPLADRR